jgi:hypothetical protein
MQFQQRACNAWLFPFFYARRCFAVVFQSHLPPEARKRSLLRVRKNNVFLSFFKDRTAPRRRAELSQKQLPWTVAKMSFHNKIVATS